MAQEISRKVEKKSSSAVTNVYIHRNKWYLISWVTEIAADIILQRYSGLQYPVISYCTVIIFVICTQHSSWLNASCIAKYRLQCWVYVLFVGSYFEWNLYDAHYGRLLMHSCSLLCDFNSFCRQAVSCFRHSKAARAKPGWLRGWHDDKPPKAITTFGVTLITFKWNEVLDTDCCCSNAIPFLGLLCMSVRVYSLCSKMGMRFLNFQKKT